MEGLIPTKEAAGIIGIKPGTLQDKAERQQISHYKIGNRLYFKKADLERFIEAHRVEARPSLPKRLRRMA